MFIYELKIPLIQVSKQQQGEESQTFREKRGGVTLLPRWRLFHGSISDNSTKELPNMTHWLSSGFWCIQCERTILYFYRWMQTLYRGYSQHVYCCILDPVPGFSRGTDTRADLYRCPSIQTFRCTYVQLTWACAHALHNCWTGLSVVCISYSILYETVFLSQPQK